MRSSFARRGQRTTAVVLLSLGSSLGLSLVQPAAAHAQTPLIAVIDSGAEATHPALLGGLVPGFDFVNGDADADDLVGHGTELASVIAGSGAVQGVCPTCVVMPLKVTEDAFFDPESLTAAIDYATTANADIILIGSGATTASANVTSAIALAQAAGILVVAPAGSEELSQILFPAALPGVVAVAAADQGDAFVRHANTSGAETVAALGEAVTCATLGGTTITRDGSSIAAAHAAGVAGLALQNDSALTPAELRQILRYGTVPSAIPGWTERFGYGVLDEGLALARSFTGFLDVAIAGLHVVPTLPQTGQVSFAQMRVENQGNAPTGPLSLVVTHAGTPAVFPLASLDVEEVVDVAIALPTGVAGQIATVEAAIVPLVGEDDVTNNGLALDVEYDDAPLHDVGLHVDPTSEPVADDGVIDVPVQVQNFGNQAEPTVVLELLVDGTAVDAQAISLAVAQSDAVTLSWLFDPTSSSGLRSLEIVASLPSPDDDAADNRWYLDLDVGWREGMARLQYANTDGITDIVIDAPWRTIRSDVPVLFFAPEFKGSERKLDSLALYPFNLTTGQPDRNNPIARDRRRDTDQLTGITLIDPAGNVRTALAPTETFGSFWHYIMRVPSTAVGNPPAAGSPHYLLGEVQWSRVRLVKQKGQDVEEPTESRQVERVLRVLFDNTALPKLDPADRHYDAHVHTIAEQTTHELKEPDAPHKNFGGPIAMLLEASYAVGLVEARLAAQPPAVANWTAFKNKLVTTDHNVFYSQESSNKLFGGAITRPSAPGYGPTSGLTAAGTEFNWYRNNLGKLAGEEVALASGSTHAGFTPNRGHHLLAYDTVHVEGPWHGGEFATSRTPNANTMQVALDAMKAQASPPGGFGYAAHPNLGNFLWPPEYFCQALGWAANTDGDDCQNAHNARAGRHVNRAETDFQFKGSQVWNAKDDETAARNNRIESVRLGLLNPFNGGHEELRFNPRPNWTTELDASLQTYYAQVRRGLVYNVTDAGDATVAKKRFTRKAYMVAGTDAHGDFNYTDDVGSTYTAEKSGAVTSNAYARVRTYTLAHQQPVVNNQTPGQDPEVDDAEERSHNAYREGNSVLSDGPICTFALDGDGRHNTAANANTRWHDATMRFENAEGKIGGLDKFDGGFTVLVPGPGNEVWLRSLWKKSVTPGASDIANFDILGVGRSSTASSTSGAGANGEPFDQEFPLGVGEPVAYVISGRATHTDVTKDERCIANPIWAMPVRIDVAYPLGCPIPRGGLTVTFHFPISISGAGGVFVRPLGNNGNSVNPETPLQAAPGWAEENGVFNGKYTARNTNAAIACPPGGWDAATHAAAAEHFSYVVYMVAPADIHANTLNDVATTFVPTRPPPGNIPTMGMRWAVALALLLMVAGVWRILVRRGAPQT